LLKEQADLKKQQKESKLNQKNWTWKPCKVVRAGTCTQTLLLSLSTNGTLRWTSTSQVYLQTTSFTSA
jgi:hypothetical protein